jgi:hypothetical protein
LQAEIGHSLTLAAEGSTDQVVLARVARFTGWSVTAAYGGRGKQHLLKRFPSFNQAATHTPWVVLLDLDRSAECAPAFVASLPPPGLRMCIRIAVRTVEAWLLADRVRLAQYLRVSRDRIPTDPELLEDPKLEMVGIARRSVDSSIRHDMVPRAGTTAREGPAYAARLQEFATQHWYIDDAAEVSNSLARCLSALRLLKRAADGGRTRW